MYSIYAQYSLFLFFNDYLLLFNINIFKCIIFFLYCKTIAKVFIFYFML